jgi:drug/metabolite transporter (DMT)-like permease
MKETRPPRRTLRSIGALLAAIVVGIVLSTGTDAVLHAAGILPPLGQPTSDPLLLLATLYRTIYSVLASYLGARLAPDRPMMHALVLGVLGVIANLAGALVMWNHPAVVGHRWYALVLAALAIPSAWVGGRLFIMQSRTKQTPRGGPLEPAGPMG